MAFDPRRHIQSRLAVMLPPPPWGWGQSLRATGRRLVNLRASPHEIALGCALGAFVSITPLLGVQTILAVVLALALRASVPAAIIGTLAGSLPIGLLTAAIVYYISRNVVRGWRLRIMNRTSAPAE